MRGIRTAAGTTVVLGMLAAQIAAATPASADDPCPLAVSFVCVLVPIAPNLDSDVDLTKQQPAADPAAPAPDTLPPADICVRGCI